MKSQKDDENFTLLDFVLWYLGVIAVYLLFGDTLTHWYKGVY